MIDPKKLTSLSVQPPWRTEPKALAGLAQSIKEIGVQEPPLVAYVDGAYHLINGHRRAAASVIAGEKAIPCRVVKAATLADAERIFSEIDANTRKLKGRDRFYGWACADDPDKFLSGMSVHARAVIRDLVKILGEDTARSLAKRDRGVDPCVATGARRVVNFLAGHAVREMPTMRAATLWLIEFKTQLFVRQVIDRGRRRDANRLAALIKENKNPRTRSLKVAA